MKKEIEYKDKEINDLKNNNIVLERATLDDGPVGIISVRLENKNA